MILVILAISSRHFNTKQGVEGPLGMKFGSPSLGGPQLKRHGVGGESATRAAGNSDRAGRKRNGAEDRRGAGRSRTPRGMEARDEASVGIVSVKSTPFGGP